MGWRSCGEKNLAETLYGGMGVLEMRKQIQLWGLPVGLSVVSLSWNCQLQASPFILGERPLLPTVLAGLSKVSCHLIGALVLQGSLSPSPTQSTGAHF